jgi:hypothetical protein
MNKIREDWQKDQKEGLDQEEVQRRLEPTFNSASLDKLNAWRLGIPVEELPKDPYIGTLDQQLKNLQRGRGLPPDKFAQQKQYEQMEKLFPDGRVPVDWRPS